jgi:uncharacterized protein (TIGR03435 family)
MTRLLTGLLIACTLFGQATNSPPAPLPQFEVASIKPAAPGQGGMFISPGPNGGLNVTNMPLKQFMGLAWRIQPYQISGGPAWIDSARYDVSAKPDHKPKQDELPLML